MCYQVNKGWFSASESQKMKARTCFISVTQKQCHLKDKAVYLFFVINTTGLFDRDIEPVSNMKEDMTSHLVHQTEVCQGSANSALSVPHKGIS